MEGQLCTGHLPVEWAGWMFGTQYKVCLPDFSSSLIYDPYLSQNCRFNLKSLYSSQKQIQRWGFWEGGGNSAWEVENRLWPVLNLLGKTIQDVSQSYPMRCEGSGVYIHHLLRISGQGLLEAEMVMPWHLQPTSWGHRLRHRDVDTEVWSVFLAYCVSKVQGLLAGHWQHLIPFFSLKIQKKFCTSISEEGREKCFS